MKTPMPEESVMSGSKATQETTPFAAPALQESEVPGSLSPVKSSVASAQALQDAMLLIHADSLDDLEGVRMTLASRLNSLRTVKGMADSPEDQQLSAMLNAIIALEHQAELQLRRTMKAHPLGPFVKCTVGLGDKQAARLLAAIGDPASRPNVAKLWAYCGYHVIDGQAPRRRKGMTANWNHKARSRVYLCAMSCIKHRHSPYRPLYEEARAKYEHLEIPDAHKHARALRIVSKAILRDLWVEARALQLGTSLSGAESIPIPSPIASS